MSRSLFVAASLALVFLSLAGPAKAQSCGVPPVPPIPPVGCRAMEPVCTCSGGYPQRCWWEFRCVR
jgi:hypothetical protein